MRESDANKLSQGLQVPLQELDVTAPRDHGAYERLGSNGRNDVSSAALFSRRLLRSAFIFEAAAKKPCGKSYRYPVAS